MAAEALDLVACEVEDAAEILEGGESEDPPHGGSLEEGRVRQVKHPPLLLHLRERSTFFFDRRFGLL